MAEHLIGISLGAEDDWPRAFESLLRRAKLNVKFGGEQHTFATERLKVAPLNLRSKEPYRLVIDRAAWWYFHPRERLKKMAMMDDVYLLNNPFTFQSMEKHTAYCAMIRLGMNIPETWLLPYKVGPSNERYPVTSARYNQLFDLDKIAEDIGYPLFMKPFDGGGWRGVSRIDNRHDLHKAYDASGQTMMHIQTGLADYEHFARSLTIGPQTRIMRYRPDRPQHERYELTTDFLKPGEKEEIRVISQTINAFFRWEFNSCETLVRRGELFPIDFANACPDVAIHSLHVHFPWAMLALLKWCVFCCASGRKMAIDLEQRRYFDEADTQTSSWQHKLAAYDRLNRAYFDTDRFENFCATELAHLDAVAHEYFTSSEFDDLLVTTVNETFQSHERDHYIGMNRYVFGQWAETQTASSKKSAADRQTVTA